MAHPKGSSWLTILPEAAAAEAGQLVKTGKVKPNPFVKAPPQSNLGRAQEAIRSAGEKHRINPAYLWGIYGTETSFGSAIDVSSTGARGPFQFEPATAKEYGYPLGVNEHGITDWKAFQRQAEAAAAYLQKHGGTKNIEGAVRSYNPGEASYLSKVIEHAQSWDGGGGNVKRGGKGAATTGGPAATDAENKAESERVANTPAPLPSIDVTTKWQELGLMLIMLLAGAILLIYGIAVAVRPKDQALTNPFKMPGGLPVPVPV